MFGYTQVYKPDLKFREFDRYQSCYCGLCKELKKLCGVRGQLSVSFDGTFLALLLTALYEPEEHLHKGRCVLHPLKPCMYQENPYLAYTARMNLLLTYYKCADDWKDERKLLRYLYGRSIAGEIRAVRAQYPQKSRVIRKSLGRLGRIEARYRRENRPVPAETIDELAGLFGAVVAEICAVHADVWEKSLRRIGNALGRFIYLADAYEDLERDAKKGCFNPLSHRAEEADFEDWIQSLLKMTAADLAQEFEKLPVIEDAAILRNILYAGIWTRFRAARERRKKSHEGSLSGTGN